MIYYCHIQVAPCILFLNGSFNSFPLPQTQEGRAGEAHVSPAGEQAGADGAAGGAHEAAKGEAITFA